jgi:hypothetical protein
MENQSILSDQKKETLQECAKWAKFFAIASFVSVAFNLLEAIFASGSNPLGTVAVIFITVLGSSITIASAILLYSFHKHTTVAIESGDNHSMDRALYNFKWYFALMGILLIVAFSFACIAMFFGMLAAA